MKWVFKSKCQDTESTVRITAQFPHSDEATSPQSLLSLASPKSSLSLRCHLSVWAFQAFVGVGVGMGREGKTSGMLRCLSSQEQWTLYASLPSPHHRNVRLSLHSCTAKEKWSCLVFKQHGTHSNCCPGAESLFSTGKCFNCFLLHNLWVIVTSWNNFEWDSHLFILPHLDF